MPGQSKWKILVTDGLDPEGQKVLFYSDNVETDVYESIAPAKLLEIVYEYDAIIVRSATKVTKEVMDCAPNLRLICRAGIGVDTIDVETATERGILVQNIPSGNSNAVAELTIGLILALARNLYTVIEVVKSLCSPGNERESDVWKKSRIRGTELRGKVLGLIGGGNIAQLVMHKALGMGMVVYCFDPYIDKKTNYPNGVQRVKNLEELLKSADFVSLHVPITPETHNIVSAEFLSQLKRGAFLINTSRGAIVDESALLDALNKGHLDGAALDVLKNEKSEFNTALIGHDRVIVTSHRGGDTNEAQRAISVEVAKSTLSYLFGGRISNAINAPNIESGGYDMDEPYLRLAESLVKFLLQITEITPSRVDICIHSSRNLYASVIERVVERAILLELSDMDTNKQRAYFLAHEAIEGMGIDARHKYFPDESDYDRDCVEITLRTKSESRTIRGEVLRGVIPQITAIDDFNIHSEFGDWMILIENNNVPLVIGNVATFLGKQGVNIEDLQIKNIKDTGKAVGVFRVTLPTHQDAQISEQIYVLKVGLSALVDDGIIQLFKIVDMR